MYRPPDLLPAPSFSRHSPPHSLSFSLFSRNNKTNRARCEIQTLEPDNWSVVWRGRGPGATGGVKTDTLCNSASFRGQYGGLITNKQLQSAIIPRSPSSSPCHAIASFYRKNKSLSRNFSRGKSRRRFDANTRMSFTSCFYLERRLIDSRIE